MTTWIEYREYRKIVERLKSWKNKEQKRSKHLIMTLKEYQEILEGKDETA